MGLLGFVALLTALVLKTPWPVTETALKAKVSVMGLGEALMGTYIFPFEVISVILIAALILGAIGIVGSIFDEVQSIGHQLT
jgi:NADH:ubiquinone oxidoreductase subunit 6 (subunit J)